MKIMRITSFIILFLLATLTSSAQTSFRNAEPTRSTITPYNKAADAAVENIAASTFIEQVKEWEITEEGKCFTSRFTMPIAWLNRQVLVRIGRSTSAFEVEVNGQKVGYAPSGAVATEFNVTKLLHTGKNDLAIRHIDAVENGVSTLHRSSKPAIEEVMIVCQPVIRVRDIICSTTINDLGEGVAEFAVAVKCDALNPKSSTINYTIRQNDTIVLARGRRDIALDMRREDTVRFVARIPKASLWSSASPQMLTLDLDNRINGRASEFIRHHFGVRSADFQFGKLYVNRRAVDLRLTNYDGKQPLDTLVVGDRNGIVIDAAMASDSLLGECDRRGIYVFVRAAIDTRSFDPSIRRNGNPSNNPQWVDTYLGLNRAALYATRHHPSVVGFVIAEGESSGYNIYESYLMMKSLERRLPVVYEGAKGEWCSDQIVIR